MTIQDTPDDSQVDLATTLRVSDVLQAYADAIDRADIPAILALFAPDAVWAYSPSTCRTGHREIGLFFQERMSVWRRTSHTVCTPRVSRDARSNSLVSTAYFEAKHLLRDGTTYAGWGRYVDVLEEAGPALLIVRRAVVAHAIQGANRVYTMLPRCPGTALADGG